MLLILAIYCILDCSAANPCDASAKPVNGAVNDCTDNLASGSSCAISCDAGFTPSGERICQNGELTDATCTVHGEWSSWGPYGACSKTCGSGTENRTRKCTNPPPSNGGSNCSGSGAESRSCNTEECPINGGWSSWRPYSVCSKTCASGTQNRTRKCTNPPPSNGGSNCSGSGAQSRSCNTEECPVNGGWSSWGAYGACSELCGFGAQNRTRNCTNPAPSNGGSNCTGSGVGNRNCTEACPGCKCSGVVDDHGHGSTCDGSWCYVASESPCGDKIGVGRYTYSSYACRYGQNKNVTASNITIQRDSVVAIIKMNRWLTAEEEHTVVPSKMAFLMGVPESDISVTEIPEGSQTRRLEHAVAFEMTIQNLNTSQYNKVHASMEKPKFEVELTNSLIDLQPAVIVYDVAVSADKIDCGNTTLGESCVKCNGHENVECSSQNGAGKCSFDGNCKAEAGLMTKENTANTSALVIILIIAGVVLAASCIAALVLLRIKKANVTNSMDPYVQQFMRLRRNKSHATQKSVAGNVNQECESMNGVHNAPSIDPLRAEKIRAKAVLTTSVGNVARRGALE